MPRRAILRPLLAVVLMATGLGACAGAPATPPEGLRVSVYQPRPDVPKDRMAIQVRNDGDAPITLTAATLRSSFFADDAVWGPGRTATVQPGYAIDLRVDIPAASCDDRPPEHAVTLSWATEDGSGETTLEPADPFHLLDLLHDSACLAEKVDAVAALAAMSLTAPPALPAPAELLIAIEPTGAAGTITVDAIRGTTLLNPAGPDGTGVDELALGVAIDANGPREIRVPIVPNRCDAHALAEDKIGTRMPLTVSASDGATGRLVLAAGDELRAQMYAFYAAYCGL